MVPPLVPLPSPQPPEEFRSALNADRLERSPLHADRRIPTKSRVSGAIRAQTIPKCTKSNGRREDQPVQQSRFMTQTTGLDATILAAMGNILRLLISVIVVLGIQSSTTTSSAWAQGFRSSDNGLVTTMEGLGGYLRLVEARVRAAPGLWARFSFSHRTMEAGATTLPLAAIDAKDQELGPGLTLVMEWLEIAGTLPFYEYDGDPDSEFNERSSDGTGDIWVAGKVSLETSQLWIAPYGKVRFRTGDENTDSFLPSITGTNPVFVPQSNFQIEAGVAATLTLTPEAIYLHGNVAYYRQDPEKFDTLQGVIYRGGVALIAPGFEIFGYWEGFHEFDNTSSKMDSRVAAGIALNMQYQDVQFTIMGGYEHLLDGNATEILLGRLDIEDEGFFLTISLPLFM